MARRPSKAEQAAQDLLEREGLDGRIPVPVDELAKRLNAEIRREPLDGALSGLLYRAPDDGHAIIGVNATHAEVRQRFTIAHEIAHLTLHSEALFVDGLVRRDHVSSVGIDPEEVEANAFAAELLMPRDSVVREVDSRVPEGGSISPAKLIRQLADVFEVSEQAMQFRLMNLGITTSF
jgi:Zn-dependent peptidase ImmA (M78 family)